MSRPPSRRVAQIRQRIADRWVTKMLGTTLGMTAFFIAYFWVLRHPIGPVHTMPLIMVDRWIAFSPLALPLYLSLWFYVSLAPALLIDRRELLSLSVTAIAISVINALYCCLLSQANTCRTAAPEKIREICLGKIGRAPR